MPWCSPRAPWRQTTRSSACWRSAAPCSASAGSNPTAGGWQGLELLAAELERQTGVGIAADALAELARRTLRQESDRGRATGGVDADSTARFAGEYRKLANLVERQGDDRIDRKLVEQAVEDRGEEDVWQLLDAIAAGRGGEALDRLHRLIAAAEDPLAARLSFFSLLASFCRQLVAVRGMMRVARVPAGEGNYARFKTSTRRRCSPRSPPAGRTRSPASTPSGSTAPTSPPAGCPSRCSPASPPTCWRPSCSSRGRAARPTSPWRVWWPT